METKMHHALEKYEENEAQVIEDNLWWVQSRKNIIRKYIQQIPKRIFSNGIIADIGCGSGGNLSTLANFSKVIGVEPSQNLAKISRSRNIAEAIYESPLWELEHKPRISIITMFDVLEHIDQDVQFLINLKNECEEDHILIISVPACPMLYGDHDRLLNHFRRYSKNTLNKCLEAAGYEPIRTDYYMFFVFPLAFLARTIDKARGLLGFRRSKISIGKFPSPINVILRAVVNLESKCSDYIRFPIGLWLFSIAKPKK